MKICLSISYGKPAGSKSHYVRTLQRIQANCVVNIVLLLVHLIFLIRSPSTLQEQHTTCMQHSICSMEKSTTGVK